jgi:hypothetical protein
MHQERCFFADDILENVVDALWLCVPRHQMMLGKNDRTIVREEKVNSPFRCGHGTCAPHRRINSLNIMQRILQ